MSVTDELIPVLKKLRLSGVLKTLDLRTKEAADGVISHHDFLFRVCCDEVQRRDSKQLEQRLRRANFETTKRLEDFEWAFNPKVPKSKLVDLATCNFIVAVRPTPSGRHRSARHAQGDGTTSRSGALAGAA
jgi:DNA replication protein DnaC